MARSTTQPAFTRYGFHYKRTGAFQRFIQHHTEINDMYWCFRPISSFADHLARHAKATETPTTLFRVSGPDERRVPRTVADFRGIAKQFENWSRLASLLSAVSYLEVYVRSVVELALRSDPLARFGSPKLLDGVIWMKRGVSDDLPALIRPCVVGTWHHRMEHYESLFGMIPGEVSTNISTLERIRRLRNSIGHAFGRPLQGNNDPLSADGGTMEGLSEDRFKRWLGLLEQVAKAIDGHLGPTHIGEFETLWHFHRWLALPRAEQEPRRERSQAFARYMHRLNINNPPARQFFTDLIAYYNKH